MFRRMNETYVDDLESKVVVVRKYKGQYVIMVPRTLWNSTPKKDRGLDLVSIYSSDHYIA